MKPLIGLTPLMDKERDSYWMLSGYMEGIIKAGGIPVMLSPAVDEEDLQVMITRIDGLLITGGNDLDPNLYGEENRACGPTNPVRDLMELKLFEFALKKNKPVLGICRGIQVMNVGCGGTLYQDLPTEHPGSVIHRMTPPYDRIMHQNRIMKGTLLYDILHKKEIGVNTRHHQAVKKLGKNCIVDAVSEDGVIEGIHIINQKFALGVQWHPEHFKDSEVSQKIFKAFVDSMI